MFEFLLEGVGCGGRFVIVSFGFSDLSSGVFVRSGFVRVGCFLFSFLFRFLGGFVVFRLFLCKVGLFF